MSWIHTYTGKKFWPLAPRPEDVCIEDIAHALALTCRFNGHCKCFYSVAEHSVRMAWSGFSCSSVSALLHDAAEAYISDMVSPIKKHIQGYKAMEEGILSAIGIRYGLEPFFWKQTKAADLTMLATEARDLLVGNQEEWVPLPEPLPFEIVPWSWKRAEQEFLRTARVLELWDLRAI